jgi:phage shock protein PspC (stress-responsive transcriptional regulator)
VTVLRRSAEGRALGGIASGIAAYTGVPVLAVRIAFVALCVANGLGLAVYAVMWVFLPQSDGRTFQSDRRAQAVLAGLLVLVAGVLSALGPIGLLPGGSTVLPVLAAVAGLVLVWQQADLAQRQRWRATAVSNALSSQTMLLRLGLGGALMVAGLVGFLAQRGQLASARAGLLSTAIVVAGLALLSSPWWVSMANDLSAERR